MKPHLHSVPSGGWYYQSGPERIDAVGYGDLCRKVARVEGIGASEAEKRVDEFVCAKNPHDCPGASQAGVIDAGGGYASTQTVSLWANAFPVAPSLVPADVAQGRTLTTDKTTGCIGCPLNKPLGCCQNKQPQGELAAQLKSLRQAKDVQRYGSELFACAAYGWDNRTAVWIEARELDLPTPLPRVPERCWTRDISPYDILQPANPNHP